MGVFSKILAHFKIKCVSTPSLIKDNISYISFRHHEWEGHGFRLFSIFGNLLLVLILGKPF